MPIKTVTEQEGTASNKGELFSVKPSQSGFGPEKRLYNGFIRGT